MWGTMKFKPKITQRSFKEHIHSIINNPYNAIVELIANAHDAGASELYIDWDVDFLNNNNMVKFQDNGHGMSNNDFKNIWVELSYDRLKNEGGEFVEIVNDNGQSFSRKVYGKNGKGRHSPFAFCDKYEVKTIHDGECSIFDVSKDSKEGFSISQREKYSTNKKMEQQFRLK